MFFAKLFRRSAPQLCPWRHWCLAVALLAWAPVAQAQWKLTGTETLTSPGPGVAHVCQTVAGPATAGVLRGEAKLHFITFSARDHTLKVYDQGPNGRASLAETMQQEHCLAGVNGGYFHPDFEPVGMLLSDGRLVRKPQRAKLLSGALVVTQHHMKLLRSTDPLPGKNARHAIQAGPYLVDGGKTTAGLNDARSARRTAVLTDGKDNWSLVSTSALTLAEMGQILADPALLPGGMKTERALNFDGGSSTALWVQQPGAAPYSIGEFGIVRDFIGLAPR